MPQPLEPDLVAELIATSGELGRGASDSVARARRLCEQSRELVASGRAARRASVLGRRDQFVAVGLAAQDIVQVVDGGHPVAVQALGQVEGEDPVQQHGPRRARL